MLKYEFKESIVTDLYNSILIYLYVNMLLSKIVMKFQLTLVGLVHNVRNQLIT